MCGNLILLRNRFYGYSFFILLSSFYNLRLKFNYLL
nr:MAG TPA: NUC130/3NT domain protein [Caudoviricetes sp.]